MIILNVTNFLSDNVVCDNVVSDNAVCDNFADIFFTRPGATISIIIIIIYISEQIQILQNHNKHINHKPE